MGRRWQREMFALRAELEATREMMSCRFSGERTDFKSLKSKLSSLKLRSEIRSPRPRCESCDVPPRRERCDVPEYRFKSPQGKSKSRSPSPTVEAIKMCDVQSNRMCEPKNNGSSPPRRRSPSPNVGLLSIRGLPQAHASLGLNAGGDMKRFCGICGVWYKLGDEAHQCSQCDLADPLSESMQQVNTTVVEIQVDERVEHFERVQRMICTQNPCLRSTMPAMPATAQGVRRMKSERLTLSSLNHSGQYNVIKSPGKLVFEEKEIPGNATNDHTRARGAELRHFGNELDALTADLIALDDEIQVACP